MNYKKIFAISLVLIALCTAGMVCAASINNPEGFTINENLTVNNGTTEFQGVQCEFTRVVMENGTDNITATNFVPSKSIDLTPIGTTVKKTISSKEGLFQQKDDGRCVFLYLENSTLVEIDAPNEKLIEEVIGK